jgi:hypothetical protein
MWWQIILDLGAVLGDGSGKGREKEQKHHNKEQLYNKKMILVPSSEMEAEKDERKDRSIMAQHLF